MVPMRQIFFLLVTTACLLTAWTRTGRAAGETVLLDFSSPTCGPCQQMRPTIHQLKERGYPVREVDTSKNPALANRYNITHVPAFVVLVRGQEFARLVGATSYVQLERMLQKAGIQPDRLGTQATVPGPVSNSMATPFAAISAAVPSSIGPPPGANTSGWGSAGRGSTAATHLLESTVRITIQDPQGNSTGTGTIVDAREGEALVLTCGHLFRSSGGKGMITITLFQATPQGAQVRSTQKGRLVDFDLQRDLGLISFRAHEQVQVAPIAPAGSRLASGTPVTTVGCNHGDNPTIVNTQVTSLNRYQGPANVEAAGAPVEGRSGGGMFNGQGQLVGVCFAADPQANEGLYAATSSIHTKLDNLGLAMIYQPLASGSGLSGQALTGLVQTDSAPAPPLAAPAPMAVRGQEAATPLNPSERELLNAMNRRSTSANTFPPTNRLAPENTSTHPGSGTAQAAALSPSEQALLEEIVRRGATSEVIVLIRPQLPDGRSEVITLQHASPNMIRALADPALPQTNTPTMATRPQELERR